MKKPHLPSKASGVYGEQLSFLPKPLFCPKWPNPATVTGRVLAEFLRGEWLDHSDLIEGASSWRLAAYVNDLKALGWPVETIDKPAPTPSCHHRKISVYGISTETIALAQDLMVAA